MIPPTPTPLGPVPTAPVGVGDISLWDYAPQAVGMWNQLGDITFGFQILVIIFLLVAAFFFLSNLIRNVTRGGEDK